MNKKPSERIAEILNDTCPYYEMSPTVKAVLIHLDEEWEKKQEEEKRNRTGFVGGGEK